MQKLRSRVSRGTLTTAWGSGSLVSLRLIEQKLCPWLLKCRCYDSVIRWQCNGRVSDGRCAAGREIASVRSPADPLATRVDVRPLVGWWIQSIRLKADERSRLPCHISYAWLSDEWWEL